MLPAAAAIEEPKTGALPFRIEPSVNYLELRRLAVLLNEYHARRYGKHKLRKAQARQLDKQSQDCWRQIQELLDEMSSHPPTTPSALLDYAAVALWHETSIGWGLTEDSCAALAQTCDDYSGRATHSERRLAWAVFAMAADRTEPVGEWPKYQAPLRWDPDL
jgi:hypothetical protein